METTSDRRLSKGERTRERILDVAVELFGERGVRGASIAEIARRCDISPPTVHAHFASKQLLYRMALLHASSSVLDRIEFELHSTHDPLMWMSMLDRLAEQIEQHPILANAMLNREPEFIAVLPQQLPNPRVREWLVDAITAGQRAGVIRPDADAAELAAGVEVLGFALLLCRLQTKMRVESNSETLKGITEVLTHGLLPRPAFSRDSETPKPSN